MRFTLWHRPTRHYRWRLVGTRATERELYALMAGSGEFLMLPVNKPPDRLKRAGSTECGQCGISRDQKLARCLVCGAEKEVAK
jgi:hypothetical protein